MRKHAVCAGAVVLMAAAPPNRHAQGRESFATMLRCILMFLFLLRCVSLQARRELGQCNRALS